MEAILVTKENINELTCHLPRDQAEHLVPGCLTWSIEGGQMTVWPNRRGAVCCGGKSRWGDWDDWLCALVLDEGHILVDVDGNESEKAP
jgi:hypothetical protein